MKAIILAGGLGTRIDKYAANIPKCMLEFLGKPIIQTQVDLYKELGINDIIIVRKHLANKIDISGVKYYDETDFDTHMVQGLFYARKEFDQDFIMSYGDLLFQKNVLEKVLDFNGEVGVVVDENWKEYWSKRYGNIKDDLETLIVKNDKITSLGIPTSNPYKQHARYVGIIKFSNGVIKEIEEIYDDAKSTSWDKPWYSSKSFKKAYMTDFVQAMVDRGINVQPIIIKNGWLEFDTNEDYEKAIEWLKDGTLEKFYSPKH